MNIFKQNVAKNLKLYLYNEKVKLNLSKKTKTA